MLTLPKTLRLVNRRHDRHPEYSRALLIHSFSQLSSILTDVVDRSTVCLTESATWKRGEEHAKTENSDAESDFLLRGTRGAKRDAGRRFHRLATSASVIEKGQDRPL